MQIDQFVMALAIAGAELAACDPHKEPIAPPNPSGADCLLDRDSKQNACLHSEAGMAERQACLERVRAAIDCTTEAGVAAWKDGAP